MSLSDFSLLVCMFLHESAPEPRSFSILQVSAVVPRSSIPGVHDESVHQFSL